MRQTEVIARRRNVKEFVERLGEEVTLSYRVRTPDGAGGWVQSDPIQREPQTLRVMNSAMAVPGFLAADSPAAMMSNSDLILLGNWNAVMSKDDEFTFGGEVYKLIRVSVRPDRVVAGATRT